MGRYYSGDIEGKFAFGVQSSNDADFFGVEGAEPNYLEYYFTNEDLPKIKEGIKECKSWLGEYKQKFDDYFKDAKTYSTEALSRNLEIGKDRANSLLEWYWRLELGEKIHACVKKTGECNFTAEL